MKGYAKLSSSRIARISNGREPCKYAEKKCLPMYTCIIYTVFIVQQMVSDLVTIHVGDGVECHLFYEGFAKK